MGQTGGIHRPEDSVANAGLPYVDHSLEDLKRLAMDRSLDITQCQGLQQADKHHLLALLKAYDAGVQATIGLGADACKRDGATTLVIEATGSEAELVEKQVLNAPGPKGMDIGGSLVKLALALPYSSQSKAGEQYCFPVSFGVTGQTRPDLEFDFTLADGAGYRLTFVSGATAFIEEAIDGIRRQQVLPKASMHALPNIKESEYQPVNVQDGSEVDLPLILGRLRAFPDQPPNRVRSSTLHGSQCCSDSQQISTCEQSIYCSGGGAHKFAHHFWESLQVKLRPVKELQAVVDGLLFIRACRQNTSSLFALGEDNKPKRLPWPEPLFPFILVNFGSGVSVLRVDSEKENDYVRVGGTACGGATFLGLARAMTTAVTFAEALMLAEKGDASKCDLLVQDIYGEEGSASLGLAGSLTAANFGKFCNPPEDKVKELCTEADTARALLHMVTQQAVLLSSAFAKQAGCVDRVFFVGGFVEEANHLARVAIASTYRSLGGCAYFLEHCDYLGAIGSLRASMRATDSGRECS